MDVVAEVAVVAMEEEVEADTAILGGAVVETGGKSVEFFSELT